MKTFLKTAALLLAAASVPSIAIGQTTDDGCGGQVELWFLNDESGSVTDTEFGQAKNFLKSVSSNFIFDSQTGFQGALIAWDETPTLVYGLGGGFPTAVNDYLRAGSGSTYPGAAMAYARDALLNRPLKKSAVQNGFLSARLSGFVFGRLGAESMLV